MYELSTIFTIPYMVYIKPIYFKLIFRKGSANNMNWVILHSVRPPFKSSVGFTHI